MISWKSYFEMVGEELELSKKRKRVLDDLFKAEKISQPVYELLDKEFTGAISEIEARQEALSDRMTSKISELEQRVKTFEMFLANLEVCHAAGEIDKEFYKRESGALTLKFEAAKEELAGIKEALATLVFGEE